MIRFIGFLFSLLMLTSCNFTEEITFNEDGSGEFIMNYDMSAVMKTLEEELGEGKDKEGKEKVKIDSVVYFKDLLIDKADSIAALSMEEQKQLKALEGAIMKIKMDEANGVFDFGFGATFTSLNDLPSVLEKMEKAKVLNSKGNAQYTQMDESAVAKASENMFEYVGFSYDGITFSRYLKEGYEQSQDDLEGLNREHSEMPEVREMLQAITYTLKYHFPRPVTSVSNKSATVSDDGKTVTLKMNFIDMIRSPETMALDVVLEK